MRHFDEKSANLQVLRICSMRSVVKPEKLQQLADQCDTQFLRISEATLRHRRFRHRDEMIWYGGQGHSIIWRPFGHLPT